MGPSHSSRRPKGGGGAPPYPAYVLEDVHPAWGPSNVNGVFEPGETVLVEPAWGTGIMFPAAFTSTALNITGPAGATYTILDYAAAYSIPIGSVATCYDCFVMSVSDPAVRPAAHWDVQFNENVPFAAQAYWFLHIGRTFPDVPVSHAFYSSIETLVHRSVTSGCGGGNYCPDVPTTRAQMAVFVLKGSLGSQYVPPPATGTVFDDVAAGSFAADWIEDLVSRGIVAGCQVSPPLYCPSASVTRAQMAVFLLKAKYGESYTPPACTGVFADVPCSPTPAFAVDWIEELYNEGISAGCGGGNYCPDAVNTRGQMAVFVAKTFHLSL